MAVTRQCVYKGTFRGDFTGPNPADRGKLGTKRHVLTDKKGIPLSVIITAANTHDTKAATEILDGIIVVKRPSPRKMKQNLCLDKGYDFPEIQHQVINRGYIPHIRHKGEKKKKSKRHRSRRWVVERTNSWHNRFRKLIRYEMKAENYLGLVSISPIVHLACCISIYGRTILGS